MSTSTSPQETSLTTLPAPCPTQPVAGRSVEDGPPVFSWTPVPGAVRYRVQVASTEAFESVHHDAPMERGTALPLASVLPEEASIAYWRVRAEAAGAEPSAWSAPAHFALASDDAAEAERSVRVDASPVPLHPDRNDTPVDQSAVPFAWEEIPGASGYQLQVAPTADFADPSVDVTVDRTTSVTLYDVLSLEVTSFHWRVRPLFRDADPGPWSDARAFAVAPPEEDEDALATPSDDPQATARAAGPVQQARTSSTFSVLVGLFTLVSFIAIILLIYLAG